MFEDRKVPTYENWVCFVGSGECLTPASWVMDDGAGNDLYACEQHYEEFKDLERLIDQKVAELRFK